MRDFQSAVAMVTGGAAGIGFAAARRLAAAGASVVIGDVGDVGDVERVAAVLRGDGLHVTGRSADVTVA